MICYLIKNSIFTKLHVAFQILHPFETERYCKAVRTLREIGKECIQKRIKEVNDGREVPNDILSFMLQSASRC